MTDGTQSLRDFRTNRCEAAFDALVQRYSRLVLSVARRRVDAPQLVQDIAQTVFLRLAQCPPEARTEAELLGWFHRTTVNAAIDAWRSQSRRQAREQTVATMEASATEDPTPTWDRLAPVLDEALNDLPATDREAILLRFFQEKPMRDVGQSLGVSEDAAKMRVGRALDRLRALLLSRGVGCTAAALGQCLDHHALGGGSLAPLPGISAATLVARNPARHPTARAPLATGGSWTPALPSLLPKGAVGLAALGVAAWIALQWVKPTSPETGRPPGIARSHVSATDVRPVSDIDGMRPGFGSSRASSPSPDPDSFVDAELALRAALTHPPATRQYPPRALLEALALFGSQTERAIPILTEAVRDPDYETRAWALTGLSHALTTLRQAAGFNGRSDTLSQALSNSIPVLTAVMLDSDGAGFLRTCALNALLSPTVYLNGARSSSGQLPPAAQDAILEALRRPEADPGSFRYEVADAVGRSQEAGDEALLAFASAMREQLEEQDPTGQRIAAFALATWPVDKPERVREVLLQDIRSKSTHSYRSARALGNLGPMATDAVPELLAFAEATRDRGSGGYSRAAREAACRLDPSLRARFPDIDEQLRSQEEALAARSGVVPHKSIGEWAAQMVRSGRIELLQTSFMHSEDPEAGRQALLQKLETELATAPESLRGDIEKAHEMIRKAEILPDTLPDAGRTLPLNNLTLTARVLAIDNPKFDEVKINQAMEPFESQNGPGPEVTAENFERISKALIALDPAFEKAWRKQLRREYPWLDRSIPGL